MTQYWTDVAPHLAIVPAQCARWISPEQTNRLDAIAVGRNGQETGKQGLREVEYQISTYSFFVFF